jgi:hypothetical protein
MMPTLDDRNKPIDPFNTRKSIDECSGEEWDAASRAYWAKTAIDKQLYEEDPVYSREEKIIKNSWLGGEDEEDLFSGNLFDEADQGDAEPVYKMIEEEDRFEQIVQILGPYYAISYCHGAALDILMDLDNAHNSNSIEVAKVHLSRMARLINETQGVNW